MLIIIFSILILICSYKLFAIAAGTMSIRRINMISWIFFLYILMQTYFSLFIVFFEFEGHYVFDKISRDSKELGAYAIMYTMVALPCAMVVVTKLFGYNKAEDLFNYFVNQPIVSSTSENDTYIRYPLYILVGVCVLSVMYLMYVIGGISLVKLGDSNIDPQVFRQSVGRGFEGNVYIKNIFCLTFTPILSYIFFVYWKKGQETSDLMVFLLLFICSFFALTYNLQKSPFIFYLLGFAFIKVVVDGYLSKKLIIYFTCISLVILIIGYVFIAKVTDPDLLFSLTKGIGGRLLLAQAMGLYAAFDIFPNQIDFLGLSSFSNLLSNLLSIETSDRSARLIMITMLPRNADVSGVMNSLFIAEAWANFGLIGVILSPIWVGIVIQTLYLTFIRMEKTPVVVALYAYFCTQGTIAGGFNDYIYNPGMMINLLMILSVIIVAKLYFQSRRVFI